MSTPMFIREPVIQGDRYVGSDLSTPPISTFRILFKSSEVTEPVLIEEVRYSTIVRNNDAGRLVLAIHPGAEDNVDMNDGSAVHIGDFEIVAGASDALGSGRIVLDLVLPVGWAFGWAADVQSAGASGQTVLHVSTHGGIIR